MYHQHLDISWWVWKNEIHHTIVSTRYKHRYPMIKNVIQQVKSERKQESGVFNDTIDANVAEAVRNMDFKTCPNPQCEFQDVPKRARQRCLLWKGNKKSVQSQLHKWTNNLMTFELRVSRDEHSSKYKVTYASVADKNPESSTFNNGPCWCTNIRDSMLTSITCVE